MVESCRQCTNTPSNVISIVASDGEYMVGVSCAHHSEAFLSHVKGLQRDGKLRDGTIKLEPLHAVGTDCIRGDADDLITPDPNPSTHPER